MAVTLVIDCAYFSNRTLHGERNTNPELTMKTNYHYMQFEYLMIRNLLSTFRSFKHDKNMVIDNVILTFDSKSWRNNITPFKPYYVEENEVLGYKENRVELKAKSDVDYFGFKTAQNDFARMIKGFIPTLQVDGLEADDLIFLVTEELKKDPKNEIIILATDGDMEQLVDDNVHFFKDVRSKTAKNGELYLTEKNFNILFGNTFHATKTTASQFFENLKNDFDIAEQESKRNLLRQINSVQTTGEYYRLISRQPSVETKIETKHKTMFLKNVAGDKKDNIFGLLRWKATTGTRNYSVTEKHILKTLDMCLFTDKPDTFYKELLNLNSPDDVKSNKELAQFLNALVLNTKQNGLAKNLATHLMHNIKLNMLDKRFIPQINQEWFKDEFNEILDSKGQLVNIDIDAISDELMKKDIGQNNIDGGSLMTQSLPDMSQFKSGNPMTEIPKESKLPESKYQPKLDENNNLDSIDFNSFLN